MMGWLAVYSAATPGTDFGDNATVRLNDDSEVQSDAFYGLSPGWEDTLRLVGRITLKARRN